MAKNVNFLGKISKMGFLSVHLGQTEYFRKLWGGTVVNKCLKSDFSAVHVFNVFALPSVVQNRPKKGKKRHFPTENLSALAAEYVMVRF